MSDVHAALHEMARAEQEASYFLEHAWAEAWITIAARDRVRLVARDRATLERHWPRNEHDGDYRKSADFCSSCIGAERRWPCPDARAVIEFWTRDA